MPAAARMASILAFPSVVTLAVLATAATRAPSRAAFVVTWRVNQARLNSTMANMTKRSMGSTTIISTMAAPRAFDSHRLDHINSASCGRRRQIVQAVRDRVDAALQSVLKHAVRTEDREGHHGEHGHDHDPLHHLRTPLVAGSIHDFRDHVAHYFLLFHR